MSDFPVKEGLFMPIPSIITKLNIVEAIHQMDQVQSGSLRSSTKFELLFENKRYPPKEVIRFASRIATGSVYQEHGGGDETNNFLIKRGFSIVLKDTFDEIGLDYTKSKGKVVKNDELHSVYNVESIVKDLDVSKIEEPIISNTEREQVVKARIGQSVFKKGLLMLEKKCRLCGVSDPRFLIASHIKPWASSNNQERLDPNNGLLLCPNHDALFDNGLISFNDDGNILISSTIDSATQLFLNVADTITIYLNDKQREYLAWHRAYKFIDFKEEHK